MMDNEVKKYDELRRKYEALKISHDFLHSECDRLSSAEKSNEELRFAVNFNAAALKAEESRCDQLRAQVEVVKGKLIGWVNPKTLHYLGEGYTCTLNPFEEGKYIQPLYTAPIPEQSVEINDVGDEQLIKTLKNIWHKSECAHVMKESIAKKIIEAVRASPNKADVPEGWNLYKTNTDAIVLAKIDNNGALCWSSGWSKDNNLMLWTFLNEAFNPLPQIKDNGDYDA